MASSHTSRCQYGFREKHSTELATVESMNRTTSSAFLPISIFMDLSQAFDTCVHAILLEQLRCYGISVASLDCFRSYRASGKRYVEIDKERSPCLNTKTGVPQGSILGPSYSWYTWTDIPNASRTLHLHLFYTTPIYSVLLSNQPHLYIKSRRVVKPRTNCAWLMRS